MTVLAEHGKSLDLLGRAGGLGRGERIYAVRFVGDKGYVVTFRQVDPLYTLDLSKKTDPRVVGRAEDPRLLGLPAPDLRRPAARRRPGRQRPGPHARHAAVAVRRLRPAPAVAQGQRLARRRSQLVGGVRPARVPLLEAGEPRRHPAGRPTARARASRARSASGSATASIAEAGRITHPPDPGDHVHAARSAARS